MYEPVIIVLLFGMGKSFWNEALLNIEIPPIEVLLVSLEVWRGFDELMKVERRDDLLLGKLTILPSLCILVSRLDSA